ncbi:RibD family protein [Nocardia shimofusensis]|uniref:RibD family protein n=1 Tax=Nocardia shimofusensis TaxID=228596 RepID=UPI000837044B|nr:dihydrofolate reductase family protein [Nocardia shimofusensis]
MTSIPERLLVSNAADFDRVDQLRAESDAILIGAGTIRSDNPRLIVKSESRQTERVAAGRARQPLKVVVSESGDLDPDVKFWHHGTDEHRPVVYTTTMGGAWARSRLGELADVVGLGHPLDFGRMLDDLGARGVRRLMVEGGSRIHTTFLMEDLADELFLAIGPVLVGDIYAPRFLLPEKFPGGSTRRRTLVDLTRVGDVAVLHYHLGENE